MKTWKNKFQKLFAVLLAICLIAGCMETSTVEAATSKSGITYYHVKLLSRKGGKKLGWNGEYYYEAGTKKIVCKGNTLTLYASLHKTKTGRYDNRNKKDFVKYGKHTFKLTSKTKYFSLELNPDNPDKPYRNNYSKTQAVKIMKLLNGLDLWIRVKDGKVISMQFAS